MELDVFVSVIKEYAQSVGFVPEKNGIWRNNTFSTESFETNAYCGFIREGQGPNGPYSDFSLCFMPEKTNNDTRCVSACAIVIVVGTEQFMYDGAIAQSPFTRRRFLRLNSNSHIYYKSDFSNITDKLPELTTKLKKEHPHIRQFDERFGQLVVAFEVVNIKNDFTVEDIPYEFKKWICAYAEFRGWPTNDAQRKEIVNVLDKLDSINSKKSLTDDEIYDILKKDKYIILQGAPGTGKTFTALNIAKKFNNNVLFTQFHAETSYSDFVYGIKPDTKSNTLIYKDSPGVLYEAIKEAKTGKDVLLIIDEINRANLSNVLGPVFYLFEKNVGQNRNYKVKIGDLDIDKLPENLYVIGTMNTADKSLAVVDFALRRRFTWITLRPQVLDRKDFRKDVFLEFENMFMRHATDDELNLQPGQSYFIASDDEDMRKRLKYELMPLIKEYFNEGFLPSAKDEFVNYFYNKIGELMYE